MTPQRKLGLEILGLMGFLACILVFLEWRYASYSAGPDKLIEDFEKKKSNAEVLWLGNSHTLLLVDYIEQITDSSRFISLAYGGIDLFWMQILILKYLKEIPKAKLILLGIDEDVLGYNQSVFKVEYGNRSFFRFTDTLYNDSKMERLLASSNFIRANRDLSHLFSSHLEDLDPLCLNTLRNTVFTPVGPFCEQRAREHSVIRYSSLLLDENKKYLKNIISLAREKKLTLILFIPPKSACYLHYRNKENISEARAVLDSLLQEEAIPLFDMNHERTYPDSLFRDPDHLNRFGAKICLAELFNFIYQKDSMLSKKLNIQSFTAEE